jgi:hypothetical protein
VFDMGGSIFGKPEYLQRFAALAFSSGAASRPVPTTDSTGADVLTEADCTRLLYGGLLVRDALQAAARIGAERATSKAVQACEAVIRERHAKGLPSGYNAVQDCIDAIRRGEGA